MRLTWQGAWRCNYGQPPLNVYGLRCKLALLMLAVVAAPHPPPSASASASRVAAAVASFRLLMCQLSEYLKCR